jgi:hypothetical protein
MSISLHVSGRPGLFYLMRREYLCQGEKPDYIKVCRLSDEEAASLVRSDGVVEPWMNENDIPKIEGASAGRYLTLVSDAPDQEFPEITRALQILLTLPASGLRPDAREIVVPGYRDQLMEIRGDAKKTAAFLKKTGLEAA